MLKIGITGNIGSGKTTVCHIFETLGIPVYYADHRGKFLLESNENVKAKVLAAFGDGICGPNNNINRALLADIVFHDTAKLTLLESIIHPAIFDDFNLWVALQNSPYILKEAALLFEAGTYKKLDKVVTVTAPFQTRLQRVQLRSQTTEEQVRARENRQWPEEKKIERADYVIYNNEEQLLLPQVLKLHKLFLSLQNGNKIPGM